MLQIGSIKISMPVFLAPMSGVSDLPFRRLVKKIGAGLVISEMIASQAMVRLTRRTMTMISRDPFEEPMAVQLAGCEPEVMAEAAKMNEDRGAQIIDINMGCPAKKVVNGYAGSSLMRDIINAKKIIQATVRAVNIPVTLKMRTGWDEQSKNAPEIARIAEEEGIKMITVHGRTRCQFYTGKADWSFIKNVKNSVNIPVICNGDIKTCEQAKEALTASRADGVMIGRGAYGRPWFINQVGHFLKHNEFLPNPSPADVRNIMIQHMEWMLSHYGNQVGVNIARKHMAWYTKGFEGSAEFRAKVNQTTHHQEVFGLIDEYFKQWV